MLILGALGVDDRKARSMIGLWIKETEKNHAAVLNAIKAARKAGTRDPIAYVEAAIRAAAGNSDFEKNRSDSGRSGKLFCREVRRRPCRGIGVAMGTDIAKIEPLPVPTLVDPAPCLPGWVNGIAGSIREDDDRRPTLTPDRMPTSEQRYELEKHCHCLTKLLQQQPANSRECAKKTFGLIAKLMLAKPARAGGSETAKARAEAYEIALSDVPSWAVELGDPQVVPR